MHNWNLGCRFGLFWVFSGGQGRQGRQHKKHFNFLVFPAVCVLKKSDKFSLVWFGFFSFFV